MLVHGGGHGGWCYQRVARLLGEAGHQVYAPTLTTLATRDPALMEQARAVGRLWTIDTGHDLMITEPQQVADALGAVAANLTGPLLPS